MVPGERYDEANVASPPTMSERGDAALAFAIASSPFWMTTRGMPRSTAMLSRMAAGASCALVAMMTSWTPRVSSSAASTCAR